MALGRSALRAVPALLLVLAGCGGGSSGSSGADIMVETVVQDLDADPEGLTTVVTFSDDPGVLDTSNFVADGGQTALSAVAAGSDWTVTWDDRVTPTHRVRVVGKGAVDNGYVHVATSDGSAPTFAITSATQVAGMGDDDIQVQFSGPYVVESEVADVDRWTLTVNGQELDLDSSTFDFDVPSQVLTITTGPLANLHADFELAATSIHSVADVALAATPVAGAATGDSTEPTLVSAEQNLAEDEFGRVIDFTFSEAMDPVFSTSLGLFSGQNPDIATSVVLAADDTLRVSFNNPIVPGVDSVDLLGVMDCHGNVMTDTNAPVTAGSTEPNTFTTDPELVTVANAGGDYVLAVFDQAIDPDDASDAAHWTVESPFGSPVDLTNAVFTYDLETRTLTIELEQDFVNGDDFAFGPVSGNEPHDVDGELFIDTWIGLITGDSTAPAVTQVVQNRAVDPTGLTIDVSFSEDLEQASAEDTANYVVSSGANVLSATRLAGFETVRLVLDTLAIPGEAMLDVAGVVDLAGTPMTPQANLALVSSDSTPPAPTAAAAAAIEGADNDTIAVTFNDDMIDVDVQDLSNWTVESPVGTPLDASNGSVTYNPAARTATLLLDGGDGVVLKRGTNFRVVFASARDLGGNTVASTPITGAVQAETHRPTVDSVSVDGVFANVLHVRFSEPCDELTDIAGWTRYMVRTSGGVAKGAPTSALADADDLGVDLTFGFAIVAASDTLDVQGVTDLAGNYLFPAMAHAVDVEDAAEPTLAPAAAVATTVSGEDNDSITVQFATRPSTWGLLDASKWTIEQGGNPLDLSGASFSFDGDLAVAIDFVGAGAESLATGQAYDVTVAALLSAQGVALSGPSTDTASAAGDALPAALPAGKARIDAAHAADSVLIEMSEAIQQGDAEDVTHIQLNGTDADAAVLVGPRTVRATWSGGVIAGDTVQVDFADLAGNTGLVSRSITPVEVAGPLVVSVAGTSVPDRGGDTVAVTFSKPVDLVTALNPANYAVQNGSGAVSLAGSVLRYTSATHTVTIRLAAGVELDVLGSLAVQVHDVADHAGLVITPPANLGGSITGDTTAPTIASTFVNWRESATGNVVEVQFSEDVDTAFATVAGNWTVSGGPTVLAVELVEYDQVRLTLSAPLGAAQTVSLTGLEDLAGNAAGTLASAPVH